MSSKSRSPGLRPIWKSRLTLALASAALTLGACSQPNDPPATPVLDVVTTSGTYTLVDIGALLPTGDPSWANGISDKGMIVGAHWTNSTRLIPFRYGTAILNLPTQGAIYGEAMAINNANMAVGWVGPDLFLRHHPAFWDPAGHQTQIPVPSTGTGDGVGTGINNIGRVVGSFQIFDPTFGQEVSHAFTWITGTQAVDLHPPGAFASVARGVDDQGYVSGWVELPPLGTPAHAYRWSPSGVATDLGTLGGAASDGFGVTNSGGTFVGWAQNASGTNRAFRWTPTQGIQDLGVGSVASEAYGVSTKGRVVGVKYSVISQPLAFTKLGGTVITLARLGGSTPTAALAVNQCGSIAGYSTTRTGLQHAVIWNHSPCDP